jgi:hypothetical protein
VRKQNSKHITYLHGAGAGGPLYWVYGGGGACQAASIMPWPIVVKRMRQQLISLSKRQIAKQKYLTAALQAEDGTDRAQSRWGMSFPAPAESTTGRGLFVRMSPFMVKFLLSIKLVS